MAEAGSVWVTVLPSLRGFRQKMDAELKGIGDVTVNVNAKFNASNIRSEAAAAAASARATVDIDADISNVRTRIEETKAILAGLSAQKATPTVVADTAAAKAELYVLTAQLNRLSTERASVQVTADTAAADAKLVAVDALKSRVSGQRANINVNVDSGGAIAQLGSVGAAASVLDAINPTIRVGVDAAGAVAGLAMTATKAFAIGGAVGGVAALGAAVLALGPAGAVAAGGLGAALLGFSGVGKALSALSSQQESAGADAQASAQKQAQAAQQVQSAQLQLARASASASQARSDAAKSVARAEQQSAQQVANAQEQAAKAVAQAEKQAESAHRALRQATSDLAREQRSLSSAWEEGKRSLQDLQDQVDGNALDQRQAALDLKDAQKDLADARASGDADQIARAQLAYDRQVETIDVLNKKTQRLSADNAAAQKAGVAGSAAVVAANDRIASAQQRVSDAARQAGDADAAVQQARVEGARSVADARAAGEQRIADAVEQGQRSITSANQQVADAQRALQQAMAQTAESGSSSADKVKQAFADLSPAAASFAQYLWSLKPALDTLKATAASGLFPPLQAGLQTLMGQFGVFNTVIGQFATAVGQALGYVLTQLASPFWVSFFSTLGSVAGPIMNQLAVVLMQLAGAFAQVILALLPFTPAALGVMSAIAGLVATLAPFIGQLVGALMPAAYAVVQAFVPLGPVLAALGPILSVLAQAFTTVLGALLQALAPVLVALTPLIQQLAMAFAANLVSSIQTLTPFLVGVATWMSQNPALVIGVITAISALVGAFGPLMTVLGIVAKALIFRKLAGLAGGLLGAGSAAGAAGSSVGLLGRAFTFLTGPVGIVIGLFTALFASNEQFRGAVMNLLGVLGGVLMQVLQALMPVFNALVGVVGQIMGVLGQLLSQVAQALVPVLNMFAGVIGQLAMALLPPLVSVVQSLMPVFGLLGQVIGSLGQALAPMMDAWMQMSTALLPPLMALLQSVVIPVFGFLARLLAGELTLAIKYVLIPAWTAIAWVLSNVVVPVVTWLAGIMSSAYRGIAAVMMWLWQSVFVPAWNAIAAVVTWAWTNILQPVVSAIWTGLQYLGAIIFTILVAPFIIAWNLISALVSAVWSNVLQPIWYGAIVPALEFMGQVFTWLYTNVVLPIWNAIGAAISFVWNSIILPVWNALVWYVNNVTIPVMQFLYYNVVKPIWDAIGAAISFVYNYVILPIWNAMIWFIQNVISPVTQWLYNNVIKPIWDAIGAAIKWTWDNVINPAFQAVWGGLQWLGARFQDGVSFIQRIWDTIRGILARPINFMINTVWNNGILTAWNKVAGLIGIPAIAPLAPIPEFASGGAINAAAGGPLSGPGTGTSDSILARVSNGEFVVREAVARRTKDFLLALNAGNGEALQAAGGTRAGDAGTYRGRSAIGMNPNRPIPGYAGGGPIEERIRAAKAWLSGPAQGIPYVWGGGSMRGMDCSGMQAAVTHILSGRAPTSGRIGTTASMPWGGFVPGINGQYAIGNKPSDHMAGTLGGQNVEQHGPSGTPFRFPSRWGADNGYFPQKFHLGEAGGSFVSGGSGGGGSWFNPLPGLVRAAFKLTDIPLAALKALVGTPPPDWRAVPVGFATKIRDSLRDWAVQKAELAGPSGAMDTAGISGPVVDQVRQVAQRFGWGQGPEWDAIFKIVQKESSWNPNAASPISSARGLFQKMTSLNGPVEPTPAGQAAWGLNYIKGRYGTPTRAWAWHQSHNWYDDGGLATGTGVMMKQTISPERVLSPRQTQAFESLVPLLSSMQYGSPAAPYSSADFTTNRGSAGVTQNNYFNQPMDEQAYTAAALRRLDFQQRIAS